MDAPPTLPENQVTPPHTSLPARLLNVFATPGEVFEEVKASPARVANWLVPVLLFAVVGVVSVLIIFSQPAILQQVREQQDKAIEQQVRDGKLTQAQADQALQVMDKFLGPAIMKISGSVFVVVASLVRCIWWAFIVWLLSRWLLRAPIDFMKTMEVAGLATMVAVLGAIVSLLLTVNLGRLGSTPSLGLLVKDFDMTRKSHLFLGAANVFHFWTLGIMAVGLAKLASVPFLRAALVLLTFFLVEQAVLVASGLGQWAQ